MRAEKPSHLEMTQSYRKSLTDWNTYITLSLKANIKEAKVKKVTGQKGQLSLNNGFVIYIFFLFFLHLPFLLYKKRRKTNSYLSTTRTGAKRKINLKETAFGIRKLGLTPWILVGVTFRRVRRQSRRFTIINRKLLTRFSERDLK